MSTVSQLVVHSLREGVALTYLCGSMGTYLVLGLEHTDSGAQMALGGIPAHRRRLDAHTLPGGKELALHCPLTPGPLLWL